MQIRAGLARWVSPGEQCEHVGPPAVEVSEPGLEEIVDVFRVEHLGRAFVDGSQNHGRGRSTSTISTGVRAETVSTPSWSTRARSPFPAGLPSIDQVPSKPTK